MLNQLKGLLENHRRRRTERLRQLARSTEESWRLCIRATDEGIEVRNHSSLKIHNVPRAIGWNDFDRIYVFKRDRMTVDDICMAFECDGRTVLEVNEEMKGWRPLIAALPNYLEGVMDADDWFAKVARPAFAPCTTLIYDATAGRDSAD